MTQFKICGITRPGDAEVAVAAGAAAIGLVFARSPRQVGIDRAREVAAAVPDGVARVGVFGNQPVSLIEEAVAACGLEWVQLSGGEPADVAREVAERTGARVLKAVHVEGASDLEAAAGFPCDALLLDAPVRDGALGGTGRRFDWGALAALGRGEPSARGALGSLARAGGSERASLPGSPALPASLAQRLVIAGGLTAENVGEAIRLFGPRAVDVSSGVERAPGVKDHEKVRAFAAAVRGTMDRDAHSHPHAHADSGEPTDWRIF